MLGKSVPAILRIPRPDPRVLTREIHTLKTIDISMVRDKMPELRPSMSLSLNIHDRQSSSNHREYYRYLMTEYLPELVKPFRHPTEKVSLTLIVAQSTLFKQSSEDSKDSKARKVRGGHILGCECVVPPFSEPDAPIIIQKVISKLPGKTISSKESNPDAVLGDKKILRGQNYDAEAIYETDQDVILFRDSNSAIDSNSEFPPSPLLIGVFDTKKMAINLEHILQRALKIAEENKVYKRIGDACGEHVVKTFAGPIPDNLLNGMSVQSAFDIAVTALTRQTGEPELIDRAHKALTEIKAKSDPDLMYAVGKELNQEYSRQKDNPTAAQRLQLYAEVTRVSPKKADDTVSSYNRR